MPGFPRGIRDLTCGLGASTLVSNLSVSLPTARRAAHVLSALGGGRVRGLSSYTYVRRMLHSEKVCRHCGGTHDHSIVMSLEGPRPQRIVIAGPATEVAARDITRVSVPLTCPATNVVWARDFDIEVEAGWKVREAHEALQALQGTYVAPSSEFGPSSVASQEGVRSELEEWTAGSLNAALEFGRTLTSLDLALPPLGAGALVLGGATATGWSLGFFVGAVALLLSSGIACIVVMLPRRIDAVDEVTFVVSRNRRVTQVWRGIQLATSLTVLGIAGLTASLLMMVAK